MASNADFECFRRFREVNVKNLLYYQVEISTIETELRRLEIKDNAAEKNLATYADSIFECRDKSGEERRQYDLVLRLRQLLAEYSTSQ